MSVVVLGAGISGISAAYHLQNLKFNVQVYESRKTSGGLLDSFSPHDGFIFDRFIHLSFTNNLYVKELFDQSCESITHTPRASNLSKGIWLKHPAQFNLAPLPTEEKVEILKGFYERETEVDIQNYEDWLRAQFGVYFSQNYPEKYTEKYWTLNPKDLSIDWVSGRFNIPQIDQIIRGSYETQVDNHYYAKSMRYPVKGGYKSYISGMTREVQINLNKRASSIDIVNKRVLFHDGEVRGFDKLISTIPLPELIPMITDVPEDILRASEKLAATSGQLVSFGFNRKIDNHLWFYIYDEDFLPSRAYSPSEKSSNNVPSGCSSIQFETYFSKYKPRVLSGDELVSHIIEKGEKMGIFTKSDIIFSDYREVAYANVIFDHDRKSNLRLIHDYLDSVGIFYCGRFGEWDYLWSDQCVVSGRNIANKINKLCG
jgi:protoporphyrinogen oxidase